MDTDAYWCTWKLASMLEMLMVNQDEYIHWFLLLTVEGWLLSISAPLLVGCDNSLRN